MKRLTRGRERENASTEKKTEKQQQQPTRSIETRKKLGECIRTLHHANSLLVWVEDEQTECEQLSRRDIHTNRTEPNRTSTSINANAISIFLASNQVLMQNTCI